MSDLFATTGVATALLVPLLLAAMMMRRVTRALARRLIVLAALPALIMSAFAFEAEYTLPGFMLGGAFIVDGTSRLFLFVGGVLMVVATAVARANRTTPQQGILFDVLLLLFISATLMAILAGDALTFFAAITMAGYALYGLIVQQGTLATQRAGAVLVLLLVISDIVIFELLLLLGKYGSGVEFSAVRQAMLASEGNAAIVALMIIGFGIKAGIIGVHFWMAPVLATASKPVRPLVIGFVFCTGVLAWVRMVPLGVAHWPLQGEWLQWAASLMIAYAIATGLLQRHYRAVLAHILMVLTALWLAVGGLLLATPQLMPSVQARWDTVLLQSVFALGALFLNSETPSHVRSLRARVLTGLNLAAAVILVLTPLALMSAIPALSTMGQSVLHATGLGIAVLAFRALRLQRQHEQAAMPRTVETFSVAILVLAAVASGLLGWPAIAFDASVGFALAVAIAAAAGWYLTPMLNRLPAVPPGDLLYIFRRMLTFLLRLAEQFGTSALPRYHQRALTALQSHINPQAWLYRLRAVEAAITRWETAVVLLLIIAMVIAIIALTTQGPNP